MVDIYKYLKELDLNEILKLLETDEDIDNIMIILQMYDINSLAEIEVLKEKIKELNKEDEDDLLAALDEKQKELQKLQNQISEKEKSREKTRGIIQSIVEKPLDFWKSNDPSTFANSLMGSLIIPSTKEKRSSVAVGIINGIVLGKKKDIKIEKTNSREQTIKQINEYKTKTKNNGKEFVI